MEAVRREEMKRGKMRSSQEDVTLRFPSKLFFTLAVKVAAFEVATVLAATHRVSFVRDDSGAHGSRKRLLTNGVWCLTALGTRRQRTDVSS